MLKRSKLILITAGLIISQVGFWSKRLNSPEQIKETSFAEIAANLGAAAVASTLAIKNPNLLLAPAAAMGSYAFAKPAQEAEVNTLELNNRVSENESKPEEHIHIARLSDSDQVPTNRIHRGRLAENSVASRDPVERHRAKKNKGREINPALTRFHVIKLDSRDCFIVGRNNDKTGELETIFISAVSPVSKTRHFMRTEGPRPNYSGIRLSAGMFSDLFPELKNRQKTLVLLHNGFTSQEASSILASLGKLPPLNA